MGIKLDKKPLERLARDIEEAQAQFRQCGDQHARLQFLNRKAVWLQEFAPRVYREMADQTLRLDHDAADAITVARIRYRYATTLHMLGDLDGAYSNISQAIDLADKLDDVLLQIAAREYRAQFLIYCGFSIEGLRLLEEARARHGELEDQTRVLERAMRCTITAATATIMTGQYVKAMHELRRFVEIAQQRGTDRPTFGIHTHLGMIYVLFEQFDEAQKLFETSLTLERANKSANDIGINLLKLAWLDCRRDSVNSQTFVYITEARELAQSIESPYGIATADLMESRALICDGRAPDSLPFLHKLIEAYPADKVPEIAAETTVLLARAALQMGDLTQAESFARQVLELAQKQHYREVESDALAVLIVVERSAGNDSAARELQNRHDTIRADLLQQADDTDFIEDKRFIETEMARQHLLLELQRTEQLQDENVQVRDERDQIQQRLISKTMHLSNKNDLLYQAQSLLRKNMEYVDSSVRAKFKDLLRTITIHLDEDDLWKEFDEQFSLAHPGFQDNLRKRFPKLTPTERKVCALMKLELPSKDICRVLRIGQRSIETHRYNIRKKMGIAGTSSITEAFVGLS